MKKNHNKNIATFALSLLALVGTYNALMINSNSLLSAQDAKNFKRLDEVYGIVKEGRTPAVTSNWKVVSKTAIKASPVALINKVESSVSTSSEFEAEAAIVESLDLKLVEVINPKKWEAGVKASDFNGTIATSNGIIESLKANLPEGMAIDISFSELTGNTFQYDLNGDVFAGMMYQVDQNSYMITLTNGPLEGTRMRFSGDAQNLEAQQDYLAETHNVEIGAFGSENEMIESTEAVAKSAVTTENASFNF